MVPNVIFDACVLYSAPLRDLLIRIAAADIVRARWTNDILDECFRAILRQRPDLDSAALTRTRELIMQAMPDSMVNGYHNEIPSLNLPDANDRHILAAAITCGAQTIVTMNLCDFPDSVLSQFGIKAVHPDHFILNVIDRHQETIVLIIKHQSSALRRPPMSPLQLIDKLEQSGLKLSSRSLRELFT